MRFAALSIATILSVSCGARAPRPAAGDASAGGYSLTDFVGGFDDQLLLPPAFARDLPLHGQEETREPPGMHQPDDGQYFSYAVLWWVAGAVDSSTAALRADLATYYAGLCGNPPSIVTLGDPETTAGGAFGSRRTGALSVGSCFAAAVPPATVEVSVAACPDHAAILILVSPQPASSQVWTDLDSIRDSFRCW
jgi:hypothetical protein